VAPATALSGAEDVPMESLNILWRGADGNYDTNPTLIPLGACIAHGGTSDVYGLEPPSAHVIKVGRYTSDELKTVYEAEVTALSALRDTQAAADGRVPTLVRMGKRELSRHSTNALSNPWLVLELSPRGTPLEAWLDAARATGGADFTQLAGCIVGDVIVALADAHLLGFVHCDVRPSNVVIVDGEEVAGGGSRRFRAVLVDWGVSRIERTSLTRIGVAAYADKRIFADGTRVRARPLFDYIACAYLWLAICCGRGRAPWLLPGYHIIDKVHQKRAEWLAERARAPGTSAPERAVLDALDRWTKDDASDGEVRADAAILWPSMPSR
jgi:serine/threonine protein kinase